MKLRYLLIALVFTFSIPGLASANPSMPGAKDGQNDKKPCNCQEDKRHHHMMHKDWQAKMQEREQKILTWVSQYTPNKKDEWTKVLAEKKALRDQWMSPENAEKREKWKQQKMAQIEELRKQLKEGKITKEEFIQKAHGGKGLSHWQLFHDLEVAVEAKNEKHAASLLNQLLEQYKMHNQMLNEMLKK